jgi:hypothetical protein
MSASRPVVVHHPEGTPGQQMPGIERQQQFEREGRWASWIRIEAGAGDFFHVPPGTIHRETIGTDVDFDGFVLRLGGGPERVDVNGPDAAGDSA